VESEPILFTKRAIFAQYRREWNANRPEGGESFDEMLTRTARENAELDIKYKKEGLERQAKWRKNPTYQSRASMRRDAKARKVLARRQADEEYKRQWLIDHGTT
jgi:hypothetical protein